jgi:hypothetical protein
VAALVNAEPGSVKEKMFQRIERAEYTKAMFLRVPSIKSKPSGGISLVKVPTDLPDKPKEAKEWRTVTESDEIEQLIMEREQVHFGQASPTPFANAPINQPSIGLAHLPRFKSCSMVIMFHPIRLTPNQTGFFSPAPKKCHPSRPSYRLMQ